MPINRCILILIFGLSSLQVLAQLGFCSGSKGDPIFHEDFGTGSGTGAALAAGITSYQYVAGDPQDGQYTISSTIGNQITSWHSYFPQTTQSNGKALIVNADYAAGRFYQTKISGLCQNTTYEFSAYLMNVYNRASMNCENGGIPVNVRFEIWDETDTQLIKKGSTGDIASTSSPVWKQFALTFQSKPSQGAVILKMFNNSAGGCGNDLAIDDIIFRSCGDLTRVNAAVTGNDNLDVCPANAPVSVSFSAVSDNSVYNQHAYQWQKSNDGENWQDIPGATTNTYSTSLLTSTTYYRVKVAEDQVNLSNNLCSSASNPFVVNFINSPNPPVSKGDVLVCGNETIPPVVVTSGADETITWFTTSTGGTPVATGNSFYPTQPGTYFAEAKKSGFNCAPSSRTGVKFEIDVAPVVQDESFLLCPNTSIVLDAGVSGADYGWSNGENSQTITVSAAGEYSVQVTNADGCSATKKINVALADNPVIQQIISEEGKITIEALNEGNFEYSLDGVNYQDSNIFHDVPGGIYTAYMRDKAGCSLATKTFPHIVLPKYITPNNDGYNDFFTLNGAGYYEFSEVIIFDRYGKIIKKGSGKNFSWDGKMNGKTLPSDDYWYSININGNITKGHFTLMR